MRIALAAAAAFGFLVLAAPAAQAAQKGDPRMDGFWVINDEARKVAEKNAHAELTPKGEEVVKANRAHAAERLEHHEPVALAAATCDHIGLPFFIDTSEPFLLVLNKDVVIQAFERYQLTTRRFYLDGRKWPDFTKLPPSVPGYSIGHWEGKDLVMETRAMTPGRGIHGGGVRGLNAVLVERAHIEPDGDHLTWTMTWTDPEMLARPMTVSFLYDRIPSPTYAYTETCDPNYNPSRIVDTQEKLR